MNYVADMISRIRVAIIKRATFVIIKNTKECAKILTKLYIDGYIEHLIMEQDYIKIFFNIKNNTISIRDIQLLSKPGLKKYISAKSLQSPHNYDYEVYLMTNKGLLNKTEAIAKNAGGIGILTIR
jgi:ribosomal protein S8|uniref:ribosomal protein S8 n=1 Tax=Thecamoeba quadrilineata TaxID=343530 RepID=UPI00226C76BC|nr:ribosomal protein S8 [Thecamoeba quadrilineata]UZN43849.1 ribosomal protein S8 [Thecamoeba quadrilineata]